MQPQIEDALIRVSRSGRYLDGDELVQFESEFASYVGTSIGIGVANGTDALELALRTCDCGPGREVIVVANAGGFAAAAVVAAGSTPVFVDVQESTLAADPGEVAASIGPRTTAVVVTHLYGHAHPQLTEIADTCARRGVALVEDCAQAAGARHRGRHVGTFGDLGAFSFYPTKNLGGLGDAGMVVTNDGALAGRCRMLRHYGRDRSGAMTLPGGRNSRMDEIQAAVLRVKLGCLEEMVARRRSIAEVYRRATPERWWAGAPDSTFAAHLAVTRSRDRGEFIQRGLDAGVGTSVHFARPDHLEPAFRPRARPLPVTERACSEVVSVPCHPFMTTSEIGRVERFLSEAACPMSAFNPNAADIADRVTSATPVEPPPSGDSVPVGRATCHRFPSHHDVRGSIVVSQAPVHLPFVPARMFQVFDVPAGELRGDHAHRRCHQMIVPLVGSVAVVVVDAASRFRIELDHPDLGLHVPPMTWTIQMDFSSDARVLVLASEVYDRSEYIDRFTEFVHLRTTSTQVDDAMLDGP